MDMTISRATMAQILDYSLLGPEVTNSELAAFIDSAIELGVGTICVPNSMVNLTVKAQEAGIRVATVAGFPHGKTPALVKAAEARLAVQSGASEVDVVLDIAVVKEGDANRLLQEIVAIREAVPSPVVLKFILETAVVSDEAIVTAVNALIAAGADFAKTSTGFHPAGGATVEAVRVMASASRGRVGIKAAGGVNTWEDAVTFVEAGATRIGTSNAGAILEGAPE
ncbi:deoxyribose-phosphate aldolase [Corynebacterium glutamicum]|nr:deoxyribose-phosphate aldolase [Corynebacterium glutamicum]QDX74638.1 deoxyribose-phosphate aldolase [Corynebacterium glutamicum]QDX77400.1 deoxyribose-phosphate aldolase [Corynebacterium glutamicum]TWS34475.1 deoxyribose-phosphate aldolase [Corynebacterium glutamicum]TWS38028.1 deoxyribose-phosphate aldolase [Corynebacterium glutamicum]